MINVDIWLNSSIYTTQQTLVFRVLFIMPPYQKFKRKISSFWSLWSTLYMFVPSFGQALSGYTMLDHLLTIILTLWQKWGHHVSPTDFTPEKKWGIMTMTFGIAVVSLQLLSSSQFASKENLILDITLRDSLVVLLLSSACIFDILPLPCKVWLVYNKHSLILD